MEEYQAAFEDIDPISIITQSPAPEGSNTGLRLEAYADSVEEWSGGKITWEFNYANAIAPPGETDNALVDGRLTLAQAMPVYEPAEYPANAALNNASFVGRQTPLVGVLAAHAWMLDVAFQHEALGQELEDTGVHVLFPAFNSGHSLMVCGEERTDLDDFDGQQILSGGVVQGRQIEALGGTPISIPYTEVYESLNRGVAACTVSSLLGVDLGGYADVANQIAYAPEAGYAITTGTLSVSQAFWDDLPLVAQQLLFDRLVSFLEGSVQGTWRAGASAIRAVLDAGGEFREFGSDAEQALQEANEGLLDEARADDSTGDGAEFVDSIVAASDEWTERITGELGFEDADTYEEFAELIENDEPDLSEYTQMVFDEIFLEHRP
jgi:TRAP-type C4-dicarboxylate transport system substrate-binding protein